MHRLSSLLAGILLVFLTSWAGVVAYSSLALGRLAPVADADSGGVLRAETQSGIHKCCVSTCPCA